MFVRFVFIITLCLMVMSCDTQGLRFAEGDEDISVSVTVGLNASQIGAYSIQYEVAHPALPFPIMGNVDPSSPSASFQISDLPPNSGYVLTMRAFNALGEEICFGQANFDVIDGVTAVVTLVLNCPTSTPGGDVRVDTTFQLNVCPYIDQASAEPRITVMSERVTLSALGIDEDNTAPITYTWSATSGLITDPTAPTTLYTCTLLGAHVVTLRVGDGDPACVQERQFTITCDPIPTCDNGIVEVTELCDDGFNDGGEGECLNCTTIQLCGDGNTDGTESCDDRGWSTACDADCTLAGCGDGTANPVRGEVCDDAGWSITCDLDCSIAYCGDGTVNAAAGEECDDEGPSLTCNSDCSTASCGDGVINLAAGEDCDTGAAGETATCDVDCSAARCGDGTPNLTAGEDCDGGAETATCNIDCTDSTCGDGIVNTTAGEVCDDRFNDGTGPLRCGLDCAAPASCGNLVVETLEDCDEGGNATATCDPDCTAVQCGDGLRNAAAGEDCDASGESPACDADCTEVSCGDSEWNQSAGEDCDDGLSGSATCDPDCTWAECGDSYVNATAGEDCDTVGNTAACDSDCTFPACGDSLYNPAAGESCDDGGNTADCDSDCSLPACGDGLYNSAAGEECDDGNSIDNDGCDSDCTVGLIACDITEATCLSGTSCYPTASGDFCLSTGTGTEGSVCTAINGCGAGLGCVSVPTDTLNTYCTPLCDEALAIPCADGDPCVDLAGASNMAACTLDSCNLFTQDCAGATSGCYPTFYGNVCWLAGAGAAGSVCADYRDCAEGLTCVDEPGVGSFCREMCDLVSPVCTDTLTTCTPTSSPDYGACTPTP